MGIKTKRNKVALKCSTFGHISPVDYSANVIVELIPYYKELMNG